MTYFSIISCLTHHEFGSRNPARDRKKNLVFHRLSIPNTSNHGKIDFTKEIIQGLLCFYWFGLAKNAEEARLFIRL